MLYTHTIYAHVCPRPRPLPPLQRGRLPDKSSAPWRPARRKSATHGNRLTILSL